MSKLNIDQKSIRELLGGRAGQVIDAFVDYLGDNGPLR